jgi:hypothetical protein
MHASNLPRSDICLMQDFLRQRDNARTSEVAYGVADPAGRSRMAMMVAIGSREMPPSR